jgi:hypothetical protein
MKSATSLVWVTAFSLFASGGALVAQETKKGDDKDKEKAVFKFDDATVGETPKGFTVAETKGGGTPATWKVEAMKDDSKAKHAVRVETKNKEAVFNLLLSDKSYAADLEVSVKVKSDTGEDDRGGGLLWRAKDADNYYTTRWNPLEKNIRLYKVEGGKRTMLKSMEIEADAKTWHELEVEHKADRIKVSFDGKEVLVAEDATFKDGGKVGLWTKADASTWFDDLEIELKK